MTELKNVSSFPGQHNHAKFLILQGKCGNPIDIEIRIQSALTHGFHSIYVPDGGNRDYIRPPKRRSPLGLSLMRFARGENSY